MNVWGTQNFAKWSLYFVIHFASISRKFHEPNFAGNPRFTVTSSKTRNRVPFAPWPKTTYRNSVSDNAVDDIVAKQNFPGQTQKREKNWKLLSLL
jgi:hypothetical protein